jgi:hypothetical protein
MREGNKRRTVRQARSKTRRNNRTTYAVLGDWNVVSDISGRVFKRSECVYTWDNKLVARSEYYEKQPQLTIKTPKDRIAVPDARPESIKFQDGGDNGDSLPWPRP